MGKGTTMVNLDTHIVTMDLVIRSSKMVPLAI